MNVRCAFWLATVVAASLAGCKSAPVQRPVPLAQASPAAEKGSGVFGGGNSATTGSSFPPKTPDPLPVIAPAAFQEPLPQPIVEQPPPNFQEPTDQTLSREWLQAEIEARNPSLEAMIAAWQAAAQVYPQKVALDDPMLMGMLAPQSVTSNVTETAYAFQLNQKLPWFGKRSLRGSVAAADADAAAEEVEDTRLKVRLAADLAFFEYFFAGRLIVLNHEN